MLAGATALGRGRKLKAASYVLGGAVVADLTLRGLTKVQEAGQLVRRVTARGDGLHSDISAWRGTTSPRSRAVCGR